MGQAQDKKVKERCILESLTVYSCLGLIKSSLIKVRTYFGPTMRINAFHDSQASNLYPQYRG
jgi:hypothetical protein